MDKLNKYHLNDHSLFKIDRYIDKILDAFINQWNCKKIKPEYVYDCLLLSSIGITIGKHVESLTSIGRDICKIIKVSVEEYRIDKYGFGMLGGFGKMCFAVSQYSKATGKMNNFSVQLNDLLVSDIIEHLKNKEYLKNRVSFTDYDCIFGMSGCLNYILDCNISDEHARRRSIEEMVNYLIWLSYIDDENENIYNFYISAEEQFTDRDKEEFPNGNINFGMSHGIIGIAVALSKAYEMGYRAEEIKKAVETIVGIYDDFKVQKLGIPYWPSLLSYESYMERTVKSRELQLPSSWCYGNTGILQGLLIIENKLHFGEREYDIKRDISRVICRSIDKFKLASPCLCHGYAGVLAMSMIVANCNLYIEKFIDELVNHIVDMSDLCTEIVENEPEIILNEENHIEGYIGEFSILNGLTGIVAVLSELIYGIDDYKTLLLIK